MQEPASVLFSLMNFYAHYRGYYSLRQYVSLENPMKDYYRVWSLVNMNAWIWSSVFHTRDTPFTEKMDYFSAGFAILYSLFYTVLRLFHLYSRSPYLIPWLLLCLTLYISHISYLSLSPRFDYSYNILANLIIGLIHNALWVIFAIPNSPLHRPISTITPNSHLDEKFNSPPRRYKASHASKALLFTLLTTLATSLELLDFPPLYRILDAHALWHLSTVPIVAFWYGFLIEDGRDDSWRLV